MKMGRPSMDPAKRKVHIALCLPPALLARIQAAAKRNHRSLSEEIRQRLLISEYGEVIRGALEWLA